MLIKSAILTAASGKIGGMVASHNSGGLYFRSIGNVTDPQSAGQIAVRNILADLSQQWGSTLSQTQRDDWDVYAAQKPVVNALGDTVFRSGQNWFIGSNTARLRGTGLSVILPAPPSGAQAPVVAPVVASVTASSNEATITFDNTFGWPTEDGAAMIVYASRPQGQGVNFFKGPYRLATTVLGNGTTAPTSPATIPLPFNVTVGQKVFFKVAVVNAAGGFQEIPLGFFLSA